MNGRMIDNETINNIKNSVDIVDIISERIPLTSRGRNLFKFDILLNVIGWDVFLPQR